MEGAGNVMSQQVVFGGDSEEVIAWSLSSEMIAAAAAPSKLELL